MADVDWSAIERSTEFQQLSRSRRRFALAATAVGLAAGVAYILIVYLADGFAREKVLGDISVGFLGGVLLVVLTWVISLLYLRRSNREWGPLEERVRAMASGEAPR